MGVNQDAGNGMSDESQCYQCEGTGRTWMNGAGFEYDVTCELCKGTGRLPEDTRTINGESPDPISTSWEYEKDLQDGMNSVTGNMRRRNAQRLLREIMGDE